MTRTFETNLYCPNCGELILVNANNMTDGFVCMSCGEKISVKKMLKDTDDDRFTICIPMAAEEIINEGNTEIREIVTEYQEKHGLVEGYCGWGDEYPDGWRPYVISFTGGPDAELYEDADGDKQPGECLYIPKIKSLNMILSKIDGILDRLEARYLPVLWNTD